VVRPPFNPFNPLKYGQFYDLFHIGGHKVIFMAPDMARPLQGAITPEIVNPHRPLPSTFQGYTAFGS
jgi:hypothetical protein